MCAAMARKSSSASEHVNIYGAHTNIARIVTITRYIHPPNHPPTRLQEEEEETPNQLRDITSSRRLQHILSPQPSTALQKLPPPPLPLPPPHSLSTALHRSAILPGPPPYLLLLLLLRRRRRRCWRLLLSQGQFVRPIVSCVDGRAPPPPHSQSYWPASGLASLDSRTTSACFESNHNMIMRAMIISVPPVTYPAL